MKTSRVARETARAVTSISKADYAPLRQTRSFAATLQEFTAQDSPREGTKQSALKHESEGDDASPLSSPSGLDIEDVPFGTPYSRKRKRGLGRPSTVTTSVSTPMRNGSSPRKGAESENAGKIKKSRRQPAKKIVTEEGELKIEPPANWEEIYDAVTEMRKDRLAPVDTMGCETLADENLSPRVRLLNFPFSPFVAILRSLSGQTIPNFNRPHALLPNQRHHQRCCHASSSN